MTLNFYKIAIPGIISLLVIGTIGFFLAFNYYPEKHVNVKVNGNCYELLENANEKYKILQAQAEINIKKMQLKMIEYDNASLPIIFSGFKGYIDEFIKRYNIHDIVSIQKVSDNPNFDKFIVKAKLEKMDLQKIVNDLTLSDFYPTGSVKGTVSLEPNEYIDDNEGKIISAVSKDYMQRETNKIVESNTKGVKLSECRFI